MILERFSFECRKTKTKVITLTNHNWVVSNHMNQSELEANTCRTRAKRGKTRAGKSRLVWFYFWLVEEVARDFLKPKQLQNHFNNNNNTLIITITIFIVSIV